MSGFLSRSTVSEGFADAEWTAGEAARIEGTLGGYVVGPAAALCKGTVDCVARLVSIFIEVAV